MTPIHLPCEVSPSEFTSAGSPTLPQWKLPGWMGTVGETALGEYACCRCKGGQRELHYACMSTLPIAANAEDTPAFSSAINSCGCLCVVCVWGDVE